MPGNVASDGNIAVNKADKNLYPQGVYILIGKWVEKIISK